MEISLTWICLVIVYSPFSYDMMQKMFNIRRCSYQDFLRIFMCYVLTVFLTIVSLYCIAIKLDQFRDGGMRVENIRSCRFFFFLPQITFKNFIGYWFQNTKILYSNLRSFLELAQLSYIYQKSISMLYDVSCN